MLLQAAGRASAYLLPGTPTHTRETCANGSSKLVLSANAARLSGSALINPNQSVTFWIAEGQAAVVGEGFPLFYGGVYEVRTTDEVYAIQASGSSKDINAIEVTA